MKTFIQKMLLLALLFCGLPSAAVESNPPGNLLIIGGALRPDNAAVWEKMVQLSGGKGAKIAVFPSAAASPEKSGKKLVSILQRYGADAFLVPLAVKWPGMAYQKVAQDAQLAAQVAASGGVYFAGGDQGRITQALVSPDGTQSAMLKAIWQVYQKGGVIGGSSAGAAIMSSTMFYDAQAVLPTLQNGVTDGKEIAPGLGFIGDEVFIDQHAIIRGRFARMLPVMLKKQYKLGLGVDENTAMWVKGRHEVEIIGYKGAILLDLSAATVDAKLKAFNLSNAKISYLDAGDKFDLVSKQLTPAADKEALDASKPYFSTPRFYPDILANTVVVDLLQDLIDNKQEKVLGLAFGEPKPDGKAEQGGFEMSFSRIPESRGYFSAALGGENYTVWNVRLDVKPILLPAKLYRY